MTNRAVKGQVKDMLLLEVFHDTGQNNVGETKGEDLRKGGSVHLKQDLKVILSRIRYAVNSIPWFGGCVLLHVRIISIAVLTSIGKRLCRGKPYTRIIVRSNKRGTTGVQRIACPHWCCGRKRTTVQSQQRIAFVSIVPAFSPHGFVVCATNFQDTLSQVALLVLWWTDLVTCDWCRNFVTEVLEEVMMPENEKKMG